MDILCSYFQYLLSACLFPKWMVHCNVCLGHIFAQPVDWFSISTGTILLQFSQLFDNPGFLFDYVSLIQKKVNWKEDYQRKIMKSSGNFAYFFFVVSCILIVSYSNNRPFARRVPEFKFWHSCCRAVFVSFVATFFSIFDIPVFWPILLLYFIVLFVITMKRQIKHMIKYKYVPFSFGKQVYTGSGASKGGKDAK